MDFLVKDSFEKVNILVFSVINCILLPINFLMMSSLHLILYFFRIVQFSRYIMVENRRIELLTSCVQGRRSPS